MNLRKRKSSQIPRNFRLFKRRDIFVENYKIDDEWVSASGTANYLINDPILDYFDVQKRRNASLPIENVGSGNIRVLSDILKMQGNSFESRVVEFINERIDNSYRNFITIAKSQEDIQDTKKYHETIDAIQYGVPFIYQAVLHDKLEKVYGSPDLLVRNDYMKYLCDDIQVDFPNISGIFDAKKRGRRKDFFPDYYYLVVDIKNSTLCLRANGINLLNQGRMQAYKGQLYIYHKMLSKIQNFDSQMAFILGRKYKYTCKSQLYCGFGWFDKLGCIDYSDIKKDKPCIAQTMKAIEWRRNVQMNYKDMSLYPIPSHENLYPNMCNKNDDEYRNQKKKLAEHIGEHTLLCWVGTGNRKKAFSKGILRFDDPRCNVDTLEITGEMRRKKISNILKVNQSLLSSGEDSQKLFIPDKICNNLYQWRDENVVEAYVDFETVPSIVLENYAEIQDPVSNNCGQRIFLVGIYYFDREWIYKSFVADTLSENCEKDILVKFTNFVIEKEFKKLFHWGRSAEPAMYRNSISYHNIANSLRDDVWHDLCTIFQQDNVAIRGCLTYGLKSIAKAMHNHGMIDTLWDEDNSVDSGTSTIVEAYKINNELRENNYNTLSDDPRMDNIIKYNTADCVVLQKILKYIREFH